LRGLGLVIAKTRAPVVPMRIFGAFDAWPISGKIHLWRRITIVVGKPIYFTDAEVARAGSKDVYARISQRVMDAIAALRPDD
jgi:1-acyl-sn-glycerol-3-phosphate acyltransferase